MIYFPSMESKIEFDSIFFALADANRRRILAIISETPLTVTQLAGHFDCTLATVSKNISVLEKAELLYKIKKGRVVYCHMNHDTWLELATYISGVANFWKTRLQELEKYVNMSK